MKYIFTLLLIFFSSLFSGFLISQVSTDPGYIPGTLCVDKDCSNIDMGAAKGIPNQIQNGNGTIATSYTVSGCGLNFAYSSVRLNQRSFGGVTPPTGSPQPTGMNLTLPVCATGTNIVKAFLYCGMSGNGTAVTATIKNPASVTTNVAMTLIGQHNDKCWGYPGTYNYRADVTSCISGGGSYTISGLPNVIGTNDTDGAVLFVIYTDPSQTYTGHFVIADGCVEGSGIGTWNITGFNVCGATNSQTNFVAVTDLQQIASVPFKMNSATDNFNYPIASQQVWDFITTNVAACTSGQNSATFGITTNGDCWNMVLAGMYYRTSCLACTSSPCVALPIELLNFKANCENEQIRLNWETATERNNKTFKLLRSENGKNFEIIATLPGANNSTTKRSYSYLDQTANEGHSYYYKLIDIDTDNSESEAGTMIYARCKNRNNTLDVSPNPSKNEVFVVSENDLHDVTISVCDGFGSVIKSFSNVDLASGEKFLIDMTDVNNGYYHLVVSGDKTVIQKKIVTYK